MKLIIDIDEERLETIRKYPLIYNSDEYKAIAHGIPYNPTGDLISREALKKEIREYAEPSSKLSDDFSRGMTECACEILDMIDNSLTVPERPRGECCGSCYLCDVGDCGADMQRGGAE